MPISGYEIETEHAPIDSTALDQSGHVLLFFNSFLPELPKSLCFMFQSTPKEQCTGLYA